MSDNKQTGSERSAQERFDRDFDAFLHDDNSRLAALYRKLPHAEPDAQLDARVRALAQRGLREQSAASAQRAPRRRANWLPIFGTAAVLVVAAGLASRMAPQIWSARTQSERADSAHATGGVAASPVAPVVEPLPTPAQEAAPAANTPLAAQNSVARTEQQDKTVASSEVGLAAKSKATDTPKPVRAPTPFPGGNAEFRKERAAVVPPASKPIAVDKVAPAPEAPQSVERFSAPASAAPAEPARAVQSAESVSASVPPRSPPPPPPASSPPPPPPVSVPSPAPAMATPPADSASPLAEAPAQPMAGAAAAPEQAQRAQKRSDALESPEHWIARIRVLLRQRQYDTALRNLRNFRRDYPNYELPADLRDLK